MPFTLSRQPCFALAAALLALGMYGLCLPDTITGEDAGELTVAAYFLGIPHPPGYPTWCLAAHPFTWIPFGSVAWRVALSSAVFGAAAVGLTSLLVSRMTKQAWPGFIAGMIFAVSKPMFTQCVVAEVYALNALCMIGCVYLLFLWKEDRRDSRLLWVALILGLGQGVHNTMTILAPIFAAYALWCAPGLLRRPKMIAMAFGLFLLGLSTFLYLPIRSLANPPIDWGNPETWENFKAVVGRDQFAFMYSQYPRSWASYGGQLWAISGYILGAWMLALFIPVGGLVGTLTLPIRWRAFGLLLVASGLIPLLVITWLQNPLMATDEWRSVMRQFYIPVTWLLALALGVCLIQNASSRLYVLHQLLAIFCCLGALQAFVLGWLHPHAWRMAHGWVDNYARNQLEQMEPNAILFAGPDHLAFPVVYLQSVEGLRKDVTLGNPYGYVDTQLLANAPENLREKLGATPRRALEPEYFAWLLPHTERPVYFSARPKLPEGTPVVFRQEGLLYRALPSNTPEGTDLVPRWPEGYVWPQQNDRAIRDSFASGYSPMSIVAEYQTKRAEYFYALGNELDGDRRTSIAEDAINSDPAMINNLATMLARNGYYLRAIPLFEKAMILDPYDEAIPKNLERARTKASTDTTFAPSMWRLGE